MLLSLIAGSIGVAFIGVSTLFVREIKSENGGCKDCDESMENHEQMMHDKKIQEQNLQFIHDQIMYCLKIIKEQKVTMDKLIESLLTIISYQLLFIVFLVGVVVVFLSVFLWYCYFTRYRNSYKGDHKGLPYGSTPCHCHMTGTTEGTSVQSQVSFSSENGRLSCSSRMKTITKLVRSEDETFTLFLTRLRIGADDLNHDGRLSDEMVERAVRLALMNNLPEECLAQISAKMTSDDVARFVDGYLKCQHGPRFQFQDQQQEVLTNQHLTLPVAARIEKITSMVRNKGETFDLFHTRLRIGADDLGDDGRLSAEMKEEAVQQALWDNIPRNCLSFISEDMTPDEMVTIVDVYLKNQTPSALQDYKHQTSSGFQYHKQQPASRLHYHHIKREE